MKKLFILLAAGLLSIRMSASNSSKSSLKADKTVNNFRGYGNSFIFVENGVEFSIFPDGQFDFYMPNFGPNVNVGFNNPGFSFSFNTGFDYNPFVQYDAFGAIIQIENTPIFYDYFGRVNQIGNVFINYNNFGRVNRIGGLNIFYRNNVFWRYDGFINNFNRFYVYRPWHQFYAIPPANFCVVNNWAYRQNYHPVRHIWYRPYVNNVRIINNNININNIHINREIRTDHRYVQAPRTRSERATREVVTRRNSTIYRTRTQNLGTQYADNDNFRGFNSNARYENNRTNFSRNNSSFNRNRVSTNSNNNRETNVRTNENVRTRETNVRTNENVRTIDRPINNSNSRTTISTRSNNNERINNNSVNVPNTSNRNTSIRSGSVERTPNANVINSRSSSNVRENSSIQRNNSTVTQNRATNPTSVRSSREGSRSTSVTSGTRARR